MFKILVTGAGKIGSLVATMLANVSDYHVIVSDVDFDHSDLPQIKQQTQQSLELITGDINDKASMISLIKEHDIDAVISCLPFFLNVQVAELAAECGIHYFDLTEDTSVTGRVKELAEGAASAFVPQCGLAPGFVSIVANSIMKKFDEVETVKLRVGALPQNSSNSLFYALTWSTDGLVNQYGNPCDGIENFEPVLLKPLAGLEPVQIDGWSYEAFNTSGGLGSLAQLWQGKVKNMTYKTLRYPGHCDKMRVLMEELKLNEDRDTLKRILQNAIPMTSNDVVLIYVSVTGTTNGNYLEDNYVKKVYPQTLAGHQWSAIQITTASGCCSIVDMVLSQKGKHSGFIYQESFPLNDFLENRFSTCYVS